MSDCFSHHCQWWLFLVLWWFAVPYWYHQTVRDPFVKYTIIYYLYTTIISIISLPTMGDLHYLLGVNWRCYHILILDQHMPIQERHCTVLTWNRKIWHPNDTCLGAHIPNSAKFRMKNVFFCQTVPVCSPIVITNCCKIFRVWAIGTAGMRN